MPTITIHKLNHLGQAVFSWAGEVLARTATALTLRAVFTRGPMDLGYVTLKPGDVFIEHFFADRWHNIYEIYDADDGAFKGWYCNITRPARITAAEVFSDDLALDVFVRPTGEALVLDEEEFAALALTEAETQAARAALHALQAHAAAGALPRTLHQ